MKVFCVLILLIFAGCSIEFDRNYDQIDDDMIRPISYRFANPETAPGDIVELDIFIVGEKITLADILDYRVSWNYYTDGYGNSAPRDETDLKLIGSPTLRNDDKMNVQILSIKFQIPADILHKADVLPNDLSNAINNHLIGDISGKFPFTKKEDALKYLESFANLPPAAQKLIPREQGILINGLAQIFSARYEIYLDIADGATMKTPRTKLRHTARWHGKLKDIDGIYVNKNPELLNYRGDTLKLSVNKENALNFKISPRDSAITLEQAFIAQTVNIEKYSVRWFFDGKEIRNNFHRLDINRETLADSDNLDIRINTSDKAKAGDTGFIWCVVYDERLGVSNFPEGRDFIAFPVKFVE